MMLTADDAECPVGTNGKMAPFDWLFLHTSYIVYSHHGDEVVDFRPAEKE